MKVEKNCGRCNGSGTVVSIVHAPYVEEGLVPSDQLLEVCDTCGGSGLIIEDSRG